MKPPVAIEKSHNKAEFICSFAKKKFRTISFFLALCVGLIANNSCDNTKMQGQAIARVGDKYLYQADIQGIIPPNTSAKDSVAIVKSYVNSWIKKMLMLEKADDFLPASAKDFSKQLEEYRNSLLIYAFEKEYVRQKLDTVVTEQDIVDYYEKNKENFVLKDNIIQVVFVKLPLNAPNIQKARALCFSNKPEDKKLLADYARQFAANYYLEDENWLLFSDLLKEIPIKTYDQEEFLKNNRYVEIQDSLFQYYVNIKGFKIRETPSPLSFEHENIKTIINNKRKIELIKDLEKKVYEEALEKKKFEIYE